MHDIIFHHYPQSPVSEKVRVAFGLKGLAWRSVDIPRMPPKPDLMPLTGGYRRTPVMQIGADVYCDSLCILRELERRYPEPGFFPGRAGGGLGWSLASWTDGAFFETAIKLVLANNLDEMPADFADDRAQLYFGPGHDLRQAQADLPHIIAQLRAQFVWVEGQLVPEGDFLTGGEPALADALCYYLVWFLRGRWVDGPGFFAQFPALVAWEARVAAIGHGAPTDLDAKQALQIAAAATPATPEDVDPADPLGLRVGMEVGVVPEGDGGDPVVLGRVRAVDAHRIAILREEPEIGPVCVHFPRLRYRVTPL